MGDSDAVAFSTFWRVFPRSRDVQNTFYHKRRVVFFHCGDSSLWSRVDDFIVREENIS